jgi:hypothetical protein
MKQKDEVLTKAIPSHSLAQAAACGCPACMTARLYPYISIYMFGMCHEAVIGDTAQSEILPGLRYCPRAITRIIKDAVWLLVHAFIH